MALHIEPNAEPIPGYRLLDRLGSGGFGEVWRAEAPGGLFKAIKFVQRDADQSDSAIVEQNSDPSRADQEWKSLVRVRSVRHPFILLLDRFENIDNYLVIVMELADRTLGDRFKECRTQGLTGIPREELLGYLIEAAEVLDLMNSQYQLQHLDIKPQNLFLVHNHIKVADFGLVKDTTSGGKLMTITGGVTPVYAAPETFDGKFSRQCDQYSLAIVFQEMLTGSRPFTGTTMKQLIMQHLQNAYDLSPLPARDRPIIARALSKNPDDRFPTCVEFVQSLRQATGKKASSSEEIVLPPASRPGSHPVIEASGEKTQAARGAAGPVRPSPPNFEVEEADFRELKPAHRQPGSGSKHPSIPVQVTPFQRARKRSTHQAAESGVVQPALVIGIGSLGIETLTQVRRAIAAEFGSPEAVPQIRLLGIDTDSESIQQAIGDGHRNCLRGHETLLARLQRPSHYIKSRDGKLPTDHWLNPKLLYRIPREQAGAGLRPLGRLALVDHYRGISKRIDLELQALCSHDTPRDIASHHDLGLRSNRPRVYVVASMAGCTGGGMFLDVAYTARKLLDDQGQSEAEIVGLFYLPTARRDAVTPTVLANTYASLAELQRFTEPDAIFSAVYETASSAVKGERITINGPAFRRCIFSPLPDPVGKVAPTTNQSAVRRVGEFLCRDLASTLGQVMDEQRQARFADLDPEGSQVRQVQLQSFNSYRIHWPRFEILEDASKRLCAQLIQRWMSKDAKPLSDSIRSWTEERWEAFGMRAESLIERFQQHAEHALQQKPELMLAESLSEMQKLVAAPSAGPGISANVTTSMVHALSEFERILGVPEDCRDAKQMNLDPSLVERTLAEISLVIADGCEQKLAELAVTLLEDPGFRLAGAEESLRQFGKMVENALQSQETLAKELASKSTQMYQRIHQLIERPVTVSAPAGGAWGLGLGRRTQGAAGGPTAADYFELMRTYAKTRYHSLVLAHLNRLYVGLRGHLSDQIREVGFCRQRLTELLGLVQSGSTKAATSTVSLGRTERVMLPPGSLQIADAVDHMLRNLTMDDVVSFDGQVQAIIKANFEALLQVCMGTSSTVRNLAPLMLQEAQAFLSGQLQGSSVADMYLARKRAEGGESADESIRDDLQKCLDEAAPEIGKLSEANEISLVSIPNDEAGRSLQVLLTAGGFKAQIVLSERSDEIVFHQENLPITWNDLEQFGPLARDAYEQRCTADAVSVHTREDVFDWQVIVEASK